MKKLMRLLILPLLVGAALGGTAGPALANYVYQGGTVATYGTGLCVNARAEVSHGDARGYRQADIESKRNNFYFNFVCADPHVKPAGYLATQGDYWKWSGDGWYMCKNLDYTYSVDNRAKVIQSAREYLPCGQGYYGTYTTSYAKDNNTWYGGSVWSGYHYLPDYS